MRENQHVTMVQGEAVTIRIVTVDQDGDPLTLTGASITWAVSPQHGDAAVLTRSTGGSGVTLATTAATDDTVVITLAPADTDELAGTYVHEAAITGAQAASIARGTCYILQSSVL